MASSAKHRRYADVARRLAKQSSDGFMWGQLVAFDVADRKAAKETPLLPPRKTQNSPTDESDA
jgi:hypothetical protein